MDLSFLKSIDCSQYIRPFCTSSIIIVISFLFIKIVMFLTSKIIELTRFNEQREMTIKSIIDSVAAYFILILAILNILSEFGFIKQSTILTSAGIITLIAGFSTQNLLKDFINGFFILFERQMKVGDYVCINEEYRGTVEEIGLRSTAIREWSMRKMYIPNGQIKTLKNYYKEKARVIIEVIVPFEENHTLVEQTLNDICSYINQKYTDKLYKIGQTTYSEFSLLGIVSLDGSIGGAKYIIIGVVNPRFQWFLRNRMYECILKIFQEKNIRIAYPKFYVRDPS